MTISRRTAPPKRARAPRAEGHPTLTPPNPTGIARPDLHPVLASLPSAWRSFAGPWLVLLLLSTPALVVVNPGVALAQPASDEGESDGDGGEEVDDEGADADADADADQDDALPSGNPYEVNEDPDAAITTLSGPCQGRRIIRIVVEGARRVAPDDILATMRLSRDVPCTENEVSRDARALWDLGFFNDIAIEAEPVGSGVVLVVKVRERPEIRAVVFRGNDEISDDDLQDEVSLDVGDVLSMTAVREQVTDLRDHYASEGYFLSRVNYEVLEVDNDRNEVDVQFTIDEGPEVKVRRINLVGNRNMSDDELQAIMATGETGIFSFITSSDTFDREKFDEDVIRLQAWYYDQGYLAMSAGTPRIELTPDREYIDITIPLEEGPRFRIGEIVVREVDENGDEIETLRPAEEFRSRVPLERGDWFNRTQIAEGLLDIQREYRDAGYAFVEVEPGTDLDEDDRIVDLSLTISRGPLVRIERIVIAGNTKTRDRVIRRELQILEGDLYSQTAIESSRAFVTRLGYFERVDISEERGTASDRMVLNIEVAERATGTFQVGAGFSSIERFLITAQIQQQNLFGRGQVLSLQLQLSGIRQQIQLRFIEPWLAGTRWSLSVDAYKTIQQQIQFNQDTTGAALAFGHPIFDQRLRFSVGYRLEHVAISDRTGGFGGTAPGALQFDPTSGFFNLFQEGRTSSVNFALTWDSRDNRQITSNGVFWRYSTEIADRALGSENIFVRHNAFARFYKNIFGPFILKLNLEFGLITSRDPGGVPGFSRYRPGGIFNIRGYPLFSLGPRVASLGGTPLGSPTRRNGAGGEPIGGNMQAFYQLELEFPIVQSVGSAESSSPMAGTHGISSERGAKPAACRSPLSLATSIRPRTPASTSPRASAPPGASASAGSRPSARSASSGVSPSGVVRGRRPSTSSSTSGIVSDATCGRSVREWTPARRRRSLDSQLLGISLTGASPPLARCPLHPPPPQDRECTSSDSPLPSPPRSSSPPSRLTSKRRFASRSSTFSVR